MKFTHVLLSLCLICILFVLSVSARGDRKESALDDETYDLLCKIIKNGGRLNKLVKDRTKAENSAIRRYQRYRKTHREIKVTDGGNIEIDGKRLLRKGEIKRTVDQIVRQSKGTSARYCAKRMALSSLGGGVKGIQKVIHSKKVWFFKLL